MCKRWSIAGDRQIRLPEVGDASVDTGEVEAAQALSPAGSSYEGPGVGGVVSAHQGTARITLRQRIGKRRSHTFLIREGLGVETPLALFFGLQQVYLSKTYMLTLHDTDLAGAGESIVKADVAIVDLSSRPCHHTGRFSDNRSWSHLQNHGYWFAVGWEHACFNNGKKTSPEVLD